jgi:F0F1-type ATP synthase assembly protein I
LILTRDPDIRRLAARILLAQAAATIILAAVLYGIRGPQHGGSALAGGAIGLVANLAMTLTGLRPARSAAGALGRLFFGQFAKVGLTVALFVIAARTGKVVWLPFLVAYLATLVAFWLVPTMAARGTQGGTTQA